MKPMTEREWAGVQEALVRGGLRECIDHLLTSRVPLSQYNRRIIQQAYDAGDGVEIEFVPLEDGWFSGQYEDCEVFQAIEHKGTLYSIVHASGSGLLSVIVGRGLIENELGLAFHSMAEAKAYVEGLIAK